MDETANNLKWAPAGVVNLVSKLVKLKKEKSEWEVIEAIVDAWEKSNPTEWESFLHELDHTKSTRKVTAVGNKQFSGVSKDKGNSEREGTGGYLRYKLDIPVKVVYMIRRMYPELPMDKKFYDKFARKFPKMVIEEVV